MAISVRPCQKRGKKHSYGIKKKIYLAKLPIRICENNIQSRIASLVNSIITKKDSLRELSSSFISLLKSKYSVEKLSNNLYNWHEFDFSYFVKELKKNKVILSLSEEAEWLQYFNEQIVKVKALKSEIEKSDKEIDQLVYQLYGLSDNEIKIVEENS